MKKTLIICLSLCLSFGAFAQIELGLEGLIHISQLDLNRVNKTSDVVSVGDEVLAIATGYDKKGKLNLSRKELLLKNKPKKEEVQEEIKEVADAE